MKKPIFLLCALGLLSLASESARATTVTFDELATQPLNGVSVKGVTFNFAIGGVASSDATFNTPIGPGGIAPYIIPPNAEGNSLGTLSFSFAQASTNISFGLARNVPVGTSGATVQLFDGSTLLETSSVLVNIPQGSAYPEGLFTSSATNVTRGTITFDQPTAAVRFAIDNFSFNAVPEPSSVLTLGVGVVGVGISAWRRRKPVH